MRFISVAVLLIALNSVGQVEPCSTYTCDSLAVRAILNSNGLDAVTVEEVTNLDSTGRVGSFNLLKRQVITMPSEIGRLTALTFIELSFNQLASLPQEIGQLVFLKSLFLEYNQLTEIPAETGQMDSLGHLNLAANQLESLPKEIGELSSLEYLVLSYNQLTSLPPETGQLTDLIGLYLDSNQLTDLPSEILNVSPTFGMNINHNRICSVPDSIEDWLDEFQGGRDTYNMSPIDSTWRGTQDCSTDMNRRIYREIMIGIVFQYDEFENSLTLTFLNSSDTKYISIYTLKGTLVKKLTTSRKNITLNTAGLESGVYYIKAVIDGKAVVRKVVL
jgi:Leucine-rich repeat (LRR) protein